MTVVTGVTGGHGFIGGYVVEALLAAGRHVIVMDRRAKSGVEHEVFLGDIRDATAMTEFAAHCDGIIHLAGVLGTQETIGNPRPATETNITGGLNFLEAITQYDLPGVHICVGNHWMNSTYSISKSTVERFAVMFRDERGTRVNQVRAVNAYGPGQVAAVPFGPGKVRKIVPAFACRALSGMPLEVYGDGEQVSDMVWVGDVAAVLVAALERAESGDVFDRVVEVGSHKHLTVNDVARGIQSEASKLCVGSVRGLVHLPMRSGEVAGAKVIADLDTLALVGVDPSTFVTFAEGAARTVRWFADNEGETWVRPK